MRYLPNYILSFAVVSFLTITLSGFHLHADFGDHAAEVEHGHELHAVDSFGDISHDVENIGDHVDVNVFEAASSFSKLPVFISADVHSPQVSASEVIVRWSIESPQIILHRRLQLRPHLRAPPIPI